MAYTMTIPIVLGIGQAGLTLSAQLKDTTGTNVGSAVTTGFVDLTVGNYTWTYAAFPTGFRGSVVFTASSVVRAIAAINPEDAETIAAIRLRTDLIINSEVTTMPILSSSARSVISGHAAEKTTLRYTAVLKDEAGVAIPGASLTLCTLTLYDEASSAIINSVTATDIKNTGRGTIDSSGNLVITLLPADNVILNTALQYETHIMLIRFTYGAAGEGNHEVAFRVKNMTKVP